jgi:subtilase family serine protease
MLKRRTFRPVLEGLEERTVPSTVGPVAVAAATTAFVVPSSTAAPAGGPGQPGGFSPAQIRHAYGFDQITFSNGTVQGDGTGQTIAIVDAYDQPNIAGDLATFDAMYGLAAPPSFLKVNQTGGTSYPTADQNWGLEISLDVEWAHAVAPGANILLV